MHVVLFENDENFVLFKNIKFYRKMFNKHEIRVWKTFELKLYQLFLE